MVNHLPTLHHNCNVQVSHTDHEISAIITKATSQQPKRLEPATNETQCQSLFWSMAYNTNPRTSN